MDYTNMLYNDKSEIEHKILEVWQAVLNRKIIDRNENFFQIGGNQILLMQVQKKLFSLTKCKIPLIVFFQYPTIGGLAGYLMKSANKNHEIVC
jgi:hypothetical protein